MTYKVLALKWRPKNFNEVVGQKHIIKLLINSLFLNKIHHSYLFSGTRGVGKTTLARLLAKGLNCYVNNIGIPCNNCNNCKEIEKGYFIDLIEIDAASKTRVEDTLDLLSGIKYMPVKGKYKIYLIDEVHMLSRHSFNALLKTLEEPPQHVKFLFATSDINKLPSTILSRCLQLHLKCINVKNISDRLKFILKSENIKIDNKSLDLISRSANGSMRDALSLTDQAIALGNNKISFNSISEMIGIINIEQPILIIEFLIKKDIINLMKEISKCAIYGIDWDSLLKEILKILHYIAMKKILKDNFIHNLEFNKDIINRIINISKNCSGKNIQNYYKIIITGRKNLLYYPEQRIGVEIILLQIIQFN
ncbi:DNA polymerase III subunit gamma/tau [Sodalis-like secondary symbiont of Drepanosiphum platanoidis]|uniref:DNA polymerase III subunit gamma/tau n=1 Tax=Sodalis-like secondary symbiont of Drepanosiphum platanoidis TaxID=2994493 RepID=UPI003464342A